MARKKRESANEAPASPGYFVVTFNSGYVCGVEAGTVDEARAKAPTDQGRIVSICEA
jgi:hypothetical protein